MKYILFLISALIPIMVAAEDIELYVGNSTIKTGAHPKVLIVFDNSGSMSTTEEVKEPYDPDKSYPALGTDHTPGSPYNYFTKGSGLDHAGVPTPDGATEKRRYPAAINNCQTARDRLEEFGFFTGYIREYTFKGSSGSWQELPDSDGSNIEIVDCWEDIDLEDPTNAGLTSKGDTLPSGYPADSLGSKASPVYYNSDINNASNNMRSGSIVTLYTENYIRWYHNPAIPLVNMSRMDIAKDTMVAFISSTPSVDFGLQIFNHNHSGENTRDGGRVVFGIQESTDEAKTNLINIITLELDPETNTPLCETVYEASRYFGGETVDFGDDDSDRGTSYTGNTPPRDTSIEDGGKYISPFDGCSNDINIILITDGAPTRDRAADAKVLALPERDLVDGANDTKPGGFSVNGTDNYLPRLAWWMKNNDINPYVEERQTSKLFTIGFGLTTAEAAADPDYVEPDAVKMLKKAAEVGGGQYYNASDTTSLRNSLNDAILQILKVDTTFTAPSVASNNFDRTQTLDSVYYAMFVPDNGPRWQGNLKKLRISSSGLVGRDDKSAIDDKGNISSTANTFWSTVAEDGPTVSKGGVVDMFSKMNPSSRKVYSDIGTGGSIALFNKTNAISPGGFGSVTDLATELGVDEVDIDNSIDWAKGVDVDDEDGDKSTADMRYDVFGDPLHSKPLVINYGGATEASQDIRIVIGTNAGALHMFDDNGDSISEKWAFMPKEFFKNIKKLRNNSASDGKLYGIDGTSVSYTEDKDHDGIIDVAYVFVGLRRGGSSYYGLDVSDKDGVPKLLWHIDESSSGFKHLGQTWSTPKVAFSPLNIVSGKPEPVLIFSAGYSPNKDTSGLGTEDSSGNGIYMIDAKTGNLLWSLTKDTSPAFDGTDSIPSSIATMDSDSDGFVDRLYFGDSGGMIWRVDMPGIDKATWKATKLASLGSDSSEESDRRFFAEPTIARAMFTETFEHTEIVDGESVTTVHRTQKPYDAILIGSGDRTSPLQSGTKDKLFVIKDENIITQNFTTPPDVIDIDDLYDYTDDPYNGLTENSAEYNALAIEVSKYKGWFIDLEGDEEKSLAKPEAIAGVAYFSAFTPTSNDDLCKLEGGQSNIYAVNLYTGIKIYTQRVFNHTSSIQDGITLVSIPDVEGGEGETDPTNRVSGDPLAILAGEAMPLCDGDGNCQGIRLSTMRSHLVVLEDN